MPSTTTGGGPSARGRAPPSPRRASRSAPPITAGDLTDLDARHWELYHVAEDPAENHNLADQHRDKLIEMIAQWYVEAGKYNVLPIDGSAVERLMAERPQVAEPRDRYVYRPGTQTVPFWSPGHGCSTGRTASPRTRRSRPAARRASCSARAPASAAGRSTSRTAELHYVHNYVRACPATEVYLAGRGARRAGHELRFEFEPTGKPDFTQGKGAPGRAQLYIDGKLVAQAEFPVTTPVAFNPGGLTCGANPGSPITPDYEAAFRFTGILHTVTVDLSGDLITDTESEMRMAMSRQ